MSTNPPPEKKIGPDDLRAEVLQSVAEDRLHAPSSKPYSALVSINIFPEAVPFESCRKQQLVESLGAQFGSRYDPPKLPNDAGINIPIEALMRITRENDQLITFSGGRLQLPGSERVTPIQKLGFGQQTLMASVNGVTAEAEYLCKQLCLLMWESTGMTRRWDEFDELVEAISYQTTTIVDLGIPLLGLLSESTQSFLEEDIGEPGGIGKFMGFGNSVDERDITLISHCREIELVVSVLDKVSGGAEDCNLTLLAHTRTEGNRNRVKVSSELDSAKHNEMVAALVRKIA
jgi:hypothetical protein